MDSILVSFYQVFNNSSSITHFQYSLAACLVLGVLTLFLLLFTKAILFGFKLSCIITFGFAVIVVSNNPQFLALATQMSPQVSAKTSAQVSDDEKPSWINTIQENTNIVKETGSRYLTNWLNSRSQ